MNQKVVTRFAPSPTGYLHIGSARTALFNYLFARHYRGSFLLRIEDTDKTRSEDKMTDAILEGLTWLDIKWDGPIVFQSQRADRHKQVAYELLAKGHAYYCFSSQEEINMQRAEALNKGESFLFRSPWRDAEPTLYPKDVKPVIRIKAPREGDTIIHDLLQGNVVVSNQVLDDMVILRSDGTPTYMLAVVVDDYDMEVTHIIRGDDHLNNAARQMLIYQAMGWEIPYFVHIPLIHAPDGTKLSKRHGALGVDAYRDMGYLPEALSNYLLRLGWAHGNDEIITREQAVEWFDIEGLGKSPARLDFDKLSSINSHYLKLKDNKFLLELVCNSLSKAISISDEDKKALMLAMDSLKVRAKNLLELAENAKIYLSEPGIHFSEEALNIIKNCNKELIRRAVDVILKLKEFTSENIASALSEFAKSESVKLGEILKPLRYIMTSGIEAGSLYELLYIIGKSNIEKRVSKYID